MKFIADLHVHSKFSRATAKNLDLENLHIAAQLKGITVVGTGDFTHPGWLEEISQKLVPAEPGLFKLKDELSQVCDQQVPRACRGMVRFILATEISNIYKKNGKTRKNHNLVLVPGLESAAKFAAQLAKIGNIKSDGRPILGLDARNLLETALETSDQAYLIPAHIWTPWFSVLGSKSGFDSIEECFEDLTPYIFAVETGLSSDPPMNWRVSGLDGLTLVSNSDAHSPSNLGRESNLLDTELSYAAIKSAIETGDPRQFLGTFEFFPEEGKYHLDGHRNCGVCLWPARTLAHGGQCPVCAKPLTLGVLHRVEELADRSPGDKPKKYHPYHSLVPLVDVLAEVFRVGPQAKKVSQAYQLALKTLGSEFAILHTLERAAIDQAGIALLGEAIERMRRKEIEVFPGYDGQYGRVKIFDAQERERLIGQKQLFVLPTRKSVAAGQVRADVQQSIPTRASAFKSVARSESSQSQPTTIVSHLNEEQRYAVEHPGGPLLIVAGPGTGKTRTLTHRIAYLIARKGISPENVLAVTFTNKAAQEMRERLHALLGPNSKLPLVATFHAFCFKVLNDLEGQGSIAVIDDDDRKSLLSEALRYAAQKGTRIDLKPQTILHHIIAAKQQIIEGSGLPQFIASENDNKIILEVYRLYQELLAIQGLNDYEDLILKVVRRFEADQEICQQYRDAYRQIFVDEYQDLNHGQYRIIRALAPPANPPENLCVIGDPDQSIYGFRGSDMRYFNRFREDYPQAEVIRLSRNYRSTQTILNASWQVIENQRIRSARTRVYSRIEGTQTISILELPHEKAEAEAVAREIEQLVGGTGYHSIDTGKVRNADVTQARTYADFALLYRTHAQHQIIAEVFELSGIPYQVASRENLFSRPGPAVLISFLKLIEGTGSYRDYEKAVLFVTPGIGKKTLIEFKNWCFSNRLTVPQGLARVQRFPIPRVKKLRQQMLNDFTRRVAQLKEAINGMRVTDKLLYLLKDTALSHIRDNDPAAREAFDGLMEISRHFGTDVGDFLGQAALQTDTDIYQPRAERVSLMTMHTAKGLEFPVVFITGCENNYIPFRRSGDQQPDLEEERRLFYVAMTRAMDRLYLTCAKKRRIHGKLESRSLSPFVADIENRLKTDESRSLKKKRGHVQLKLF
ncbi:MAG: UvrD-helicase domain-containing protein [Desulfobacterales bacterium]|nr:MAG: UvrD-helicase domain-containing protein [Desulfobacterales bacterium]